MKTLVFVFLGSVLAFPACSTDSPKSEAPTPSTPAASTPAAATPAATTPPAPAAPASTPPAPAAPAPAAGGADMDASIKALMAKAEHSATAIEVQHILISFSGAGTKAKRSKAEAETLAKQVYAEVVAGGDFDALVTKYTDDSPPGKYKMTSGAGRAPGSYPRSGMVPAFGNVGWRLQPGEVGVAPWDSVASPYGWHIIKRLN